MQTPLFILFEYTLSQIWISIQWLKIVQLLRALLLTVLHDENLTTFNETQDV